MKLVERTINRTGAALRYFNASARVLPEFLVLGAQKAGTTSLHSFLAQHPQILMAARKEVHYFDHRHYRGERWYRSFFPTRAAVRAREDAIGARAISGELTPDYLHHPAAPARVAACLPGIKLIAVLRDPARRAYSQYQMSVRRGHESLSFAQALEAEDQRLAGERTRLLRDERYYSVSYIHHSYRSRGYYAAQLRAYFDYFSPSRLLVIGSDELLARPQDAFDRVSDHLGLRRHQLEHLTAHNVARYRSPQAMLDSLYAHYASHNADLFELLGRDFDWRPPASAAP